MQYENYEKRIKRVAKVLSVIVRKLPIIIPTLCVIVAGISALLVVKGTVGEMSAPERLTYGESIKCEANAFMSEVSFEYATDIEGEWTDKAPILPGTYYVRAVANGSFGTNKYSEAQMFVIYQKAIDVTPNASMVYGELPTLTGALSYGDQFVCEGFECEDLLAEKTLVTPVASAVRVVDTAGNDVTHAYTLNIIPASVKVLPRKITVTVEDSTKQYDGKALSFDKYELTSGELASGDVLIATFDKVITEVGTVRNTPTSLRVVTSDDRDATHKYTITQNVGVLSIEKRTLIVKAGDGFGTYNGKSQVCLDYTIDPSTPLARQHYATVIGHPSYTDSGTYSNWVRLQIFNYEGVDVTSNHYIIYETGTFVIEKLDITVTTASSSWVYDGSSHSGSQKDVSVSGLAYAEKFDPSSYSSISSVGTAENRISGYIYSSERKMETTHNYNIHYEYGTLEVTPRTVSIKTENYNSVYSGYEKECWKWHVTSELGFVGTDTLTILSGTVGTDVISTKNEIYSYKLTNAYGADVSQNYVIENIEFGTFVISQHYIAIMPNDVTVIYDGKSHTSTEIIIAGSQGAIHPDHVFTSDFSGSRVNVGTTKCSIVNGTIVIKDGDGRDITHNYYPLIYDTADITIIPRTVYVQTKSDTKVYDDTPLTKHDFEVSDPTEDSGLLEGHVITLDGAYTGSQTNVGKSENTVNATKIVIKYNREDVTDNYYVELTYGTLEVTKRTITVESYSAEKKYDGTPLTAGGGMHESSKYPLVEGHELFLDITGSQTKIGSSTNNIEVIGTKILRGSADVTANYEINYVQGTLTVKGWAVISVTSASDAKQYDGTPLTNPNYEVVIKEGELKEGHYFDVSVTGSQTEVGVSNNKMTFTVRDAYNKNSNVNQYYTITRTYGKLEVYDGLNMSVTVAKIKTERGGAVYLRQDSYGGYTGTTNWQSTAAYSALLPGGYNCNYLTSFALKSSGAATRNAQIELICEGYMLPYYIGAEGDNVVPRTDTFYTDYTRYCGSEYSVSYYAMTEEALLDVYSLRGNLGEYAAAELEYRKYVHINYTDVPTDTRAYMEEIIKQKGFDISDGDVVFKIANFIRNSAEYNLEYDKALDTSGDVAVEFLKTYKEGVCRHYATSATMLYRTLGLPARYVTGYMVETIAGEWTEVTTPGHAWVEVYIDGVGWIQVEVTGSSDSGNSGGNSMPLLELTPKYQSKKYDGKPLEAKSDLEITPDLEALLKQGYYYTVTVKGMRTEVGLGSSSITEFTLYDKDGNPVNDNFKIIYNDGVLEVLDPDINVITVLLYQLQKQYDGTPLAFGDGDWEILDIGDGLTLDITLNISLTNVGFLTISDINGSIDKYVTYTVKNAAGEDVTELCRIIFEASNVDGSEYIPLNISTRGIELTAASANKLYDGEPLSNPKVTITMGTLAKDHTLSAIARGDITEAGTVINEIDHTSLVITDAEGNDVTRNYTIRLVDGKLEVIDPEEE